MEKIILKPIEIVKMTVNELILSAQEGNGFAFTELWDRYIERLRNYIKSWTNSLNEIDIDDICSRSFEKAFRQIHNYDASKSKFFTWLMIIAKNTTLDILARQKRIYPEKKMVYLDSDTAIQDISTSHDNPLDKLIEYEDIKEKEKYINGLPAIYRQVAKRRMIDGASYKEIAQEVDLQLNTVKTRIRRAKDIIDRMYRDNKEDEKYN